MANLTEILAAIGALIVSSGTIGAIALGLFKVFGEKIA